MKISIIVAVSENNAIGRNNQLPWHLPNDLKFFKKTTMGHHIIMGRKTFESIGKALPGRTSVVISSRKGFPGINTVTSLPEAIGLAKKSGETEAFIIGGAAVINEAIHLADTIYLTEAKTVIPDADVFLEHFDRSQWKEVSRIEHRQDETHAFDYAFVKLERA